MADPPKKVGSLRDRIAAFEKSSTNAPAPGPPPVKPKPGGVSWKPRPVTPPLEDAGSSTSEKKVLSGMSASDAKESIGKAGSLKERMAALQGRGGFGASPPPIAPKPAVERPKWKPPPAVAAPANDEEQAEPTKSPIISADSPASVPTSPPAVEGSEESGPVQTDEAKPADEEDPEEEERQRRAAIAARMARLGGARVGMGPPVFGKPAIRKPSLPKEETSSEGPTTKSPPPTSAPELSDSIPQPEEDTLESASPKPAARVPTTMPVPAAPRRAGPPRRKTPQTPAQSPPVDETTSEPSLEAQAVEPETTAETVSSPPNPQPAADPVSASPVEREELVTPAASKGEPEEPVSDDATAEEEVDEATRKQRIADKLAQMGAVNPFGPPPQRKASVEVSSPPPAERVDSVDIGSLQQVDKDDEEAPLPSPPPRQPTLDPPVLVREQSVDITSPTQQLTRPIPERAIPEPKPVTEADKEDEEGASIDEDLVSSHVSNEPLPTKLVTRETSTVADERSSEIPFKEKTADSPEASLPNTDDEAEPDSPIRAVPPPIPASTRPNIPLPPPPTASSDEGEEPFIKRSVPPPPALVPEFDSDEEEPVHPAIPVRIIPPTPVLPIPGEREQLKPPAVIPEEDSDSSPRPTSPDEGDVIDSPPSPEPADKPSADSDTVDEAQGIDDDADEQDTAPLPTPPPRPEAGHGPRTNVAKPSALQDIEAKVAESMFSPETSSRNFTAFAHSAQFVSPQSPDSPAATLAVHQSPKEVLDEEEGDPIDPSFHTPRSRRTSTIDLEEAKPSPTGLEPGIAKAEPETELAKATIESPKLTAHEPPVEDEEQARRRTIAERMAKLGGIKFGAPPPVPATRPRPAATVEENPEEQAPATETEPEAAELTEEEEERARKARIAAKLAGMGGQRIGMLPLGAGATHAPSPPAPAHAPPPPPQRPVPPPQRAVPPPQPPSSHGTDSEYDSVDDGVKVEAEESELEEVSYEEARAEVEEETPPPVPSRGTRRSSGPPVSPDSTQSAHTPPGRPPVPTSAPPRRPSGQTPTSRKSSADSPVSPYARPSNPHKSHSEYVMVEEPQEDDDFQAPPPPPPRRESRPPPAHDAPHPPAPANLSDSVSQWELPSIPTSSLDIGSGSDLSMSWSDDFTSAVSQPTPASQAPTISKRTSLPPTSPQADEHLSSEELIALWGRVGVHVCEVATSLFEKSKKALIGDGTYHGFVQAVLADVANASSPSPPSYGHLVYMQSAGSVQKRASDIMPGDVIWVSDAKFKGHKGIQAYSQNVGNGEPLVGIVSEFEPKKFKLRVFQANQHVGQQTVEAVSYRLEDLKGGVVKIFRILEA